MDRIGNDRDNKELDFFNERVIKYRKEDIVRLVSLVSVCAVTFCLAAYAVLFWIKPFFAVYLFGKQKNIQENILSTIKDNGDSQNVVTTYLSDEMQTIDEGGNGTELYGNISREDMYQSVVVIVSGDNEDGNVKGMEKGKTDKEMTDGELLARKISSGLVVLKNENIDILTSYEKVKGLDEVTVFFDSDRGYKGQIKSVSSDYRIAVIEVRGTDMPDSEFDKIKPAVFADKEEYPAAEEIIFIGNSPDKKKFMINASLTSEGNAVSIMDGEADILVTDIVKDGKMNGFAFDKTGRVIGMAVNNVSCNNGTDMFLYLVRICDLKPYINKMINKQKIPYMGIYGREVTVEVIKNIDNEMPYGIYIFNMMENSPAYLAGIMNGDILVAINNTKISDFGGYVKALQGCQAGQEIVVSIMRKGKDGYKQFRYVVKVSGK